MNAISLTNISKTFRLPDRKSSPALENINLEIQEGEFFILIGPSGCGKSTLLRIISGLEKEHLGSVKFSQTISKTDFSFVFQQFALLPWLTVAQNVELGLLQRNMTDKDRFENVKQELSKLRLEHIANKYPRELSGGMKQRVGIARALVTDPKIIFLDEPFSELDSFTAEELRQELLSIWQERRPTIVMVTHIIEEALELADRIAVMTPHPGKIENIYNNTLTRPRQKRTTEFYQLEDELYKCLKP